MLMLTVSVILLLCSGLRNALRPDPAPAPAPALLQLMLLLCSCPRHVLHRRVAKILEHVHDVLTAPTSLSGPVAVEYIWLLRNHLLVPEYQQLYEPCKLKELLVTVMEYLEGIRRSCPESLPGQQTEELQDLLVTVMEYLQGIRRSCRESLPGQQTEEVHRLVSLLGGMLTALTGGLAPLDCVGEFMVQLLQWMLAIRDVTRTALATVGAASTWLLEWGKDNLKGDLLLKFLQSFSTSESVDPHLALPYSPPSNRPTKRSRIASPLRLPSLNQLLDMALTCPAKWGPVLAVLLAVHLPILPPRFCTKLLASVTSKLRDTLARSPHHRQSHSTRGTTHKASGLVHKPPVGSDKSLRGQYESVAFHTDACGLVWLLRSVTAVTNTSHSFASCSSSPSFASSSTALLPPSSTSSVSPASASAFSPSSSPLAALAGMSKALLEAASSLSSLCPRPPHSLRLLAILNALLAPPPSSSLDASGFPEGSAKIHVSPDPPFSLRPPTLHAPILSLASPGVAKVVEAFVRMCIISHGSAKQPKPVGPASGV
eukprot:gene15048-21124_t